MLLDFQHNSSVRKRANEFPYYLIEISDKYFIARDSKFIAHEKTEIACYIENDSDLQSFLLNIFFKHEFIYFQLYAAMPDSYGHEWKIYYENKISNKDFNESKFVIYTNEIVPHIHKESATNKNKNLDLQTLIQYRDTGLLEEYLAHHDPIPESQGSETKEELEILYSFQKDWNTRRIIYDPNIGKKRFKSYTSKIKRKSKLEKQVIITKQINNVICSIITYSNNIFKGCLDTRHYFTENAKRYNKARFLFTYFSILLVLKIKHSNFEDIVTGSIFLVENYKQYFVKEIETLQKHSEKNKLTIQEYKILQDDLNKSIPLIKKYIKKYSSKK